MKSSVNVLVPGFANITLAHGFASAAETSVVAASGAPPALKRSRPPEAQASHATIHPPRVTTPSVYDQAHEGHRMRSPGARRLFAVLRRADERTTLLRTRRLSR